MNYPMRSPSEVDGSKGGRLESSMKHEALFYVVMTVLASGAYLGGSELALKWLHWYASQAPIAAPVQPAPAPPPPNFAVQQAQAQAQVRQSIINNYTAQAQFSTDKIARENARRILQDLGVQTPTTPPPTPAMAVAFKR